MGGWGLEGQGRPGWLPWRCEGWCFTWFMYLLDFLNTLHNPKANGELVVYAIPILILSLFYYYYYF